jgi:hypothetical protein
MENQSQKSEMRSLCRLKSSDLMTKQMATIVDSKMTPERDDQTPKDGAELRSGELGNVGETSISGACNSGKGYVNG